jgi:Fur family transcriptional regulator, ferric uptake regulator
MKDLAEIIKRLHKAGHKVTPQRLTIISVILESTELLTPAAVFKIVQMKDSQIGEVTVYRTLNILAETDLVCVLHTDGNVQSYIGRPAEHHDHLICSGCGKVVNFTDCNILDLEKRLKTETGFDIREHRLDFYGTCGNCSKKRPSNDKTAIASTRAN